MEKKNKVTTESYWNSVWQSASDVDILNESHFYYGKNGIFKKLITEKLGDIKNKSVLELGGGGQNFRLLAMAKLLGAQVTALDYSAQGLDVAERLFSLNNCKADFINKDFTEWLPGETKFDFVVHWGVAEHFIDPFPMLEKSVSALKPGGVLMFSMPNMEALAAKPWRRWCPDSWSKHVFHKTSVIESILQNLQLVDVHGFHFGVPMVKAADWEEKSLWQYPIGALQKFASATARVAPIYHRYGHKLLSSERGFVGRSKSSASGS